MFNSQYSIPPHFIISKLFHKSIRHTFQALMRVSFITFSRKPRVLAHPTKIFIPENSFFTLSLNNIKYHDYYHLNAQSNFFHQTLNNIFKKKIKVTR
jgi:hypothetical protein